jgi:hypothetical protein
MADRGFVTPEEEALDAANRIILKQQQEILILRAQRDERWQDVRAIIERLDRLESWLSARAMSKS